MRDRVCEQTLISTVAVIRHDQSQQYAVSCVIFWRGGHGFKRNFFVIATWQNVFQSFMI